MFLMNPQDHTIGGSIDGGSFWALFLVTPVCLDTIYGPPAKSILIPSHPCLPSPSLFLSHAMRTLRRMLPCILLLLLVSHCLPTTILGLRTLREEQVRSDLRRHEHEIAPAISPSREVVGGGDGGDDADAASKYAVSRRMVPQGPNPLHNRWDEQHICWWLW